jgi:pimeloyl-ACP methyl ester carboxylesterase
MTELNDQILHYEVGGAGQLVVLLHGYLSGLRYWDSLRGDLQARHKVIAIDLLGFGRSPKPSHVQYDYDDQIAWIQRTLDYIGVTEPVIFVGHSMGALIALRYASKLPDQVARLILMNPPFLASINEARRELSGTNLLYRISLYGQMHRVIFPIMRNPIMKCLMHLIAPPVYAGMENYIFSSSARSRNRSLRHLIENQRSMMDIACVTLPITLIQGLKERPAYLANVRLVGDLPHLNVVHANTGHHTVLEMPELAMRLMNV